MNTILYIIGYVSLFISMIAAFVAVEKNKYTPLIVSACLLVCSFIILWVLK